MTFGESRDVEGDSLSYEVEIYTDARMTNRVFYEEGLVSESGKITFDAGILAKGVYYWRARAFDGEDYGSWSGTRVINVADEAVRRVNGRKVQ